MRMTDTEEKVVVAAAGTRDKKQMAIDVIKNVLVLVGISGIVAMLLGYK